MYFKNIKCYPYRYLRAKFDKICDFDLNFSDPSDDVNIFALSSIDEVLISLKSLKNQFSNIDFVNINLSKYLPFLL